MTPLVFDPCDGTSQRRLSWLQGHFRNPKDLVDLPTDNMTHHSLLAQLQQKGFHGGGGGGSMVRSANSILSPSINLVIKVLALRSTYIPIDQAARSINLLHRLIYCSTGLRVSKDSLHPLAY